MLQRPRFTPAGPEHDWEQAEHVGRYYGTDRHSTSSQINLLERLFNKRIRFLLAKAVKVFKRFESTERQFPQQRAQPSVGSSSDNNALSQPLLQQQHPPTAMCSSSRVGWGLISIAIGCPNASIPWPIKFSSIPTPEQIRWGEREKLHHLSQTMYSVEYKKARPLANWYNYRGEKRKWDKIPIKKFSGILHLHTLKLFSFISLYWSNCFIFSLLNSPLRNVYVEQKCTIMSFQIPFIKGLECMCTGWTKRLAALICYIFPESQKWRKTFLVTLYWPVCFSTPESISQSWLIARDRRGVIIVLKTWWASKKKWGRRAMGRRWTFQSIVNSRGGNLKPLVKCKHWKAKSYQ